MPLAYQTFTHRINWIYIQAKGFPRLQHTPRGYQSARRPVKGSSRAALFSSAAYTRLLYLLFGSRELNNSTE